MSHLPLTLVQDRLADFGVLATILPGAQGRSARMFAATGYPHGCQAICSHHTVSSGLRPESDIAFILNGNGDGYVISNAYTALDGHVTLIASGPTYTEGSGGPRGTIPANGGNTVCFSNEIASWGADNSPYPNPQQHAALVLAAVVGEIAAEIYEWTEPAWHPWRNFAHFEWAPGRKVDPRGVSRWSPQGGLWNMNAFRADIETLLTQSPEHDMTNEFLLRLKGRADVVKVVDNTPMPLSKHALNVEMYAGTPNLYGVAPAGANQKDPRESPAPYHAGTAAWLEHQLGYPLTPSPV